MFRSLTVTVTRKPGYDEIPQKVQVTVTVTVARNPGYDEIPQKVQVTVTVTVLVKGLLSFVSKGHYHLLIGVSSQDLTIDNQQRKNKILK
jgi:hypothetical protein